MIYLLFALVVLTRIHGESYTPHSQGSHGEVLRRARGVSSVASCPETHGFSTFWSAAEIFVAVGNHYLLTLKMETV